MRDPVEVTTGKVVPEHPFRPTGLRLYGVQVREVTVKDFTVELAVSEQNGKPELAVIYGYSYEGHCYALPKPCIAAVNSDTREPAVGCGYDRQNRFLMEALDPDKKKNPPQYYMWKADKLTKTLEIAITGGFVEDIILNQALTGPRAPVAYSARAMLAHRNGKLTE